MRETTKKIQFYLSSFTIHEAMVSLFFRRPFTKFKFGECEICETYAKREKQTIESERMNERKKKNRITHISRSERLVDCCRSESKMCTRSIEENDNDFFSS